MFSRGAQHRRTIVAKKSKSMKGNDGERKLATGAGRKKQNSGGEAQKNSEERQGSGDNPRSAKRAKH
jgi:hypothetical protein